MVVTEWKPAERSASHVFITWGSVVDGRCSSEYVLRSCGVDEHTRNSAAGIVDGADWLTRDMDIGMAVYTR